MIQHSLFGLAAGIALAAALPAAGRGQEVAPPDTGTTAPDFALRGATSDGVLERPVRLSDFRDKTVVIAFFYRARTRG
ncbi:MAG: hypothetical protein AB7I33_12735 [Gemmatimonadales bacterium]